MIKLKTKEEIEIMREGGRRLAVILQKIAEACKPGVMTGDLDKLAFKLIVEGGDRPSFLDYKPSNTKKGFPSTLCVSINEEIVHGVPAINSKEIREGDIVGLDCGLIHKGMFLDHAITIGVGEISLEAKRLLQVTKEALSSGVKQARIGNKIGDIGSAVAKQAHDNGFGIIQGLSGHGVGYAVHEDPYVPNEGRKGEGVVMEEGLVIAIEPMFSLGGGDIKLARDGFTFVTKDGSIAAQFEHTVAVTENGPEILTKV
ncbi:type I methionyl aminopeptidase [Candidatus Nomurabacteria bacterium]|nr:type I methionyl aminopeptidase [Candidatus Nomurabacteria bacterium]